MVFCGLGALSILESPSSCPAWHFAELLGIVWLILENALGFWDGKRSGVWMLSFLERVGDSTGVWEGPAPPSKLL